MRAAVLKAFPPAVAGNSLRRFSLPIFAQLEEDKDLIVRVIGRHCAAFIARWPVLALCLGRLPRAMFTRFSFDDASPLVLAAVISMHCLFFRLHLACTLGLRAKLYHLRLSVVCLRRRFRVNALALTTT
jgi:hypothetical protein